MVKSNRTYTILTIEDEPDIQTFISCVLELEGFSVRKASNGNIGLAILKEHHIDLVLLDLRLPGPNGWSVLREIKHTPELQKIPVLIITAIAENSQRYRALRLGAALYLIKPLSSDRLSQAVTEILHKKAADHSIKKEYAVSHSYSRKA
jgi:DNA-binding response OmpR family regulator